MQSDPIIVNTPITFTLLLDRFTGTPPVQAGTNPGTIIPELV